MNPIKSLPALDWNDIARAEIILTGEDLVAHSHVAMQIGNVAVAGLVYYAGFFNPPWFWFALARGITIKHLIDFRRMMEYIPTGSLTAVNENEPQALKFARLYGFEETGQIREHEGKVFKIFRRI